MAPAKPMPISATMLPAFNVIAELRASAATSQRLACQPGAFLRWLDQAFLLTLVDSPVARIYGLLYEKHLAEIDLADCFIEDIDQSVLLRHAQPPETLVRAILDKTPGWAFRRGLDLSLQTSHSVQSALLHADARVDRSANVPQSNEALAELSSRIGHSVDGTHISAHAAPRLAEAMPLRNGGGPRALQQGMSVSVVRWSTSFPAHSAVGHTAFEALPQPAEATELLNVALLRLAASSQHADAGAGLAAASGLKDLMGGLTAVERGRAPELQPLIDYYVAGCEWSTGRLDTARSKLQIGAGNLERLQGLDEASVEQLVRANCAGRLAWLDAFCGNLRRSMRYATAVLTTRRADTAEIGVRFAQLATVLVHIERSEIEQAKQRLDHAVSLGPDEGDPLLASAQLLTQVRLAMVTDGPAAVLRQVEPTTGLGGDTTPGWFPEQVTLATAHAYLAAGEARRAISLLTSVPQSATGDAWLLLARAHRVAGNFADAVAALTQTGAHSAVNTLVTEVRRWLLLAQLHAERNDIQVAGILVDRALGAASSEALVETVRESDGWLRSFVARDSRLLVRHSGFLACLGYETALPAPRRPEKSDLAAGALIAVPLTARETDVLNLLADYCSNEEIATDLVVSMNTVKTHIRSLFQKLSVTRRADAVRRGRAMGLC